MDSRCHPPSLSTSTADEESQKPEIAIPVFTHRESGSTAVTELSACLCSPAAPLWVKHLGIVGTDHALSGKKEPNQHLGVVRSTETRSWP
jgi:hypothetical protein